ncbi:MAG: hypothetical protein DHS20C07_25240 [Methyloligella sp.]|nr:MAG: hypothetical protein DHS20C07_25240 [Methyloligella sp.]
MIKLKFSFFLLFFTLSPAFTHNAHALPEHHKVTITAVEKCLGLAKKAIEFGHKKHPLVSCNIPFSFNEAELDAALQQSTSKSKDTTSEKTKSHKAVKTIINVKSAKCMAKIRVKSELLQKAIDMKEGKITLPRQPVTCALKTNSNKAKQAKFSFQPKGLFQNSCLKEFSPQMGNFKLDCTFCRLNIVATTMTYWVNHIGSRMAPGINKALGKKCSG